MLRSGNYDVRGFCAAAQADGCGARVVKEARSPEARYCPCAAPSDRPARSSLALLVENAQHAIEAALIIPIFGDAPPAAFAHRGDGFGIIDAPSHRPREVFH